MKHLVLLALLIAARDAHAAPATYAEGEKLYNAGRYLDAAEKFRAAYDSEADPAFLLDIAQAYRFGEDCANSALYYRKYLAKVPDAKVQVILDEQDACAKKKAALAPPVVVKPVDAKPEPPGHMRLYVGIAAGVVGLGLGALGWYEDSKLDDIVARRSVGVAYCTSTNVCTSAQYMASAKPYDDLASAKQRNAIIAYSVGGLALAAATYLLVTDLMPEEEHVHLSATPTSAMAFASWRF